MRVFNLTDGNLDFHGKTLPPGGSAEIPSLDGHISNRDRDLEKNKKIAFKALPGWFVSRKEIEAKNKKSKAAKQLPTPTIVPVIVPIVKPIIPAEELVVEAPQAVDPSPPVVPVKKKNQAPSGPDDQTKGR